jgi:hypothetical protein
MGLMNRREYRNFSLCLFSRDLVGDFDAGILYKDFVKKLLCKNFYIYTWN